MKPVNMPEVPGPDAPTEPLVTVGTIVALVTAIIAVAVTFGLPLTEAQQGAILTFVAVAAPLVLMVIGRGKVFAPATVRAMVRQAAKSGPSEDVL